MGVTKSVESNALINKNHGKPNYSRTFVLAGSPNVGKSTLFNALTGMNQHTGNWAGKTVSCAEGRFKGEGCKYRVIDLPGVYSLFSGSPEQELARDFVCFEKYDALVALCDATNLERNLILILQLIESAKGVVLCVNMMDEAKRCGIKIDLEALESMLGVPVLGISARDSNTLSGLEKTIDRTIRESKGGNELKYPTAVSQARDILANKLMPYINDEKKANFISLRLLGGDESFERSLGEHLGFSPMENKEIMEGYDLAFSILRENGISSSIEFKDRVLSTLVLNAEIISHACVGEETSSHIMRDRRIDGVLTSRKYGFPIMLLLLLFVFFITLWGANYISAGLSAIFDEILILLEYLLEKAEIGGGMRGIIIDGMYRTLSAVISVMLPPMAIFFPLFTLLEDSGYMPRIAYNLDRPFKKCNSCGKQALTMCMGLGCNAAGVVGCRIIDSKKERLIAILTNSFMPCNGKFSGMIAMIGCFIITGAGLLSKLGAAFVLLLFLLLSVGVTFGISYLISVSVLKGSSSDFILELPSYRRPQFMKVLVRSVFDRTLFILGRAVCVAIPAGAVIWILANTAVGGVSIIAYIVRLLDGIGKFMGLDGVILAAFILGFPANEIVIPLMIMMYSGTDSIVMDASFESVVGLFINNGWNIQKAICFIIFLIFHMPCSTTLISIKKETGSYFWTFVSALLPTFIGFLFCVIINLVFGGNI